MQDALSLLTHDGLQLDFGAATGRVKLRGKIEGAADALTSVYHAFEPIRSPAFCAATVTLQPSRTRAGGRTGIELLADGESLFEPFDAGSHLPLIEWGLNWLLAHRLLHVLLLHAGSVALGDRAVVMPAMPGSGKSTLTAALACRGFRLLSDEFGIVDLDSGELIPLVRPISLKNASIDVIRRFAPHATLGPRFPNTRKGTVAHVAPDAESVAARHRRAKPVAIVFPRYEGGAPLSLEPIARTMAFSKLAINSFNYGMLGPKGFRCVARLVDACDCLVLRYGELDDAIAAVRAMLSDGHRVA